MGDRAVSMELGESWNKWMIFAEDGATELARRYKSCDIQGKSKLAAPYKPVELELANFPLATRGQNMKRRFELHHPFKLAIQPWRNSKFQKG